MVAKFSTGSSLMKTLNYNEQKVRQGLAELLSVANYPLDAHELSYSQKLNRLLNQAALNENVHANSVHISLNFDPLEVLSDELLSEIAEVYMEGVGFANQPYLVYRHHDSGHPHLHIVSVKVDADGKRIETQNIGKLQSNRTRKEIELTYGLVRAEDHKLEENYLARPVNAQRVRYGKSETRRAISNVLKNVLEAYRYSSLPELNAVLKLYNIRAWRGNEDTNTYKHRGLLYQVIDSEGNPLGVPVKASLFYMKPTLDRLEEKFTANAQLKEPLKKRTKSKIDLAFIKNPRTTLEQLTKALEKEAISIVPRQNNEGRIYGITYVDHNQKAVFNGSDLGKQYSANAIQERCGIVLPEQKTSVSKSDIIHEDTRTNMSHQEPVSGPEGGGLADALLHQEFTGETLPYELRTNKKKKRKRLNNNQ